MSTISKRDDENRTSEQARNVSKNQKNSDLVLEGGEGAEGEDEDDHVAHQEYKSRNA